MTPEETPAPLPRLSAQQEEFCQQYLFDSVGGKAARRAGVSPGMSRKRACMWMKLPQIQARIAELKAERRERLQIDVDTQLLDLVEMVKVDVNEIVEHRRVNCRRCWGVGHRYQWGPVEAEEEQERWDKLPEKAKADTPAPDFQGGMDFNPWRDPNPKCPCCGGVGEGKPFFHDTRNLSPAARRLYEGVQVTKDGTKVLVTDKSGLIDKVNRALGLYKDKVELTGKDGGAIKSEATFVDPIEAAKAYQKLMNGQ